MHIFSQGIRNLRNQNHLRRALRHYFHISVHLSPVETTALKNINIRAMTPKIVQFTFKTLPASCFGKLIYLAYLLRDCFHAKLPSIIMNT